MITDICSMMILLAAATTLEIQPAIDFLDTPSSRTDGHEVTVLTTGVGSVAATYALMRKIGQRRPDLVIQAGIAGAFYNPSSSPIVGPGSVLAIKEEILADLGVWETGSWKTLFDLRLIGQHDPPFFGGLLINPYQPLLTLSGLPAVRSITVNEITTDPERIGWIQQNWAPVVESMEGGALHYVCLQEQIPFLQIRSISNPVGERDKTKWELRKAVQHLNEQLIALFKNLKGINSIA